MTCIFTFEYNYKKIVVKESVLQSCYEIVQFMSLYCFQFTDYFYEYFAYLNKNYTKYGW